MACELCTAFLCFALTSCKRSRGRKQAERDSRWRQSPTRQGSRQRGQEAHQKAQGGSLHHRPGQSCNEHRAHHTGCHKNGGGAGVGPCDGCMQTLHGLHLAHRLCTGAAVLCVGEYACAGTTDTVSATVLAPSLPSRLSATHYQHTAGRAQRIARLCLSRCPCSTPPTSTFRQRQPLVLLLMQQVLSLRSPSVLRGLR